MADELFRDIINLLDEGFCIIDVIFDDAGKPVDWRYLETNHRFAEQAGRAAGIGQTHNEVFMETEPYFYEFYGQVAASGISAHMQNEHKNLNRWYDISACKVGGMVSRKVAVLFRDITERKQAEEALRESEHKALALVRALEKADKNKNQFISMMSHELRNPLAVIVASLSLLEITDSEEQISKSKEVIKRQVDQLTKLVDDLLDLTRINQNKIMLKNEAIDLNKTLDNALKDAAPEYRAKGVRLRAKLHKTPLLLHADPVRISQSIGNILKNALNYTQATGTVTLTLETEGDEAVIRVQDNGIGIELDLLEHLFEPFTQADTSLDRQSGGGLGLGLSIVKGITELHGGSVAAFSEGLGKGALFTIRLPIPVRDTKATDHKKMKRTWRHSKT